MKSAQGLISNIERFALHDGPGIRTLIFMKGCPLRCLWCSSPQTQNPFPEVLCDASKCQKCGHCTGACPEEAMMLSEQNGVTLDRKLCTGCGECVEACPNQALELVGNYVTTEQLLKELNCDSSFYRRSDGGISVGGGEPTMQPEFVAELLKRAQRQYIHTAIETCGYVKWEYLKNLLEYVDLVYFDIKHMDAFIHTDLTGVPNELILENARKTSAVRPMAIRIPTVPGYNDSHENILATSRFTADLGKNLQGIELLPYHALGVQTYGRLGKAYQLKEVEPPDGRHMERLKEIVESCGVKAHIGG